MWDVEAPPAAAAWSKYSCSSEGSCVMATRSAGQGTGAGSGVGMVMDHLGRHRGARDWARHQQSRGAGAAGGGGRRRRPHAAAAADTHQLARWWGWARPPWRGSACHPLPTCGACNDSQGLASLAATTLHSPLTVPGVPAAVSAFPEAHQYSHMVPAAVQAHRYSSECPSRARETCCCRMQQLAAQQQADKSVIARNAAMHDCR